MIKIEAVLDTNGVLRTCSASGHSGAGPKGADIICAAVSVLMRTAVRVLSGRKGITIRYYAPEPGFLSVEADYTEEGKDFLFAVGEFLVEGLASVAGEYPESCNFVVRRT